MQLPKTALVFAPRLNGLLPRRLFQVFLGTFLYAISFVGDLPVPKTIDTGQAGLLAPALIIDILLLGLFAIQHSAMARPAFKRWWTRFVPQPVERTTYVLLASLTLVLLYWQWRPISQPVWSVTHPAGVVVLQAIFWIGWAIGNRNDGVFDLLCDAVFQHWLLATDLLQRQLAAFVIEFLETVEAVAAVTHHLAGLADIAEPLGEPRSPTLARMIFCSAVMWCPPIR
jgi:hypothetical protein